MKTFIVELEKRGGHVLDIIKTCDNKKLLYYRECGDYATATKTKIFDF
jgi:hypothetical protein